MKRYAAVLLLALLAGYFTASTRDCCDELSGRAAPVCHLACTDGCATAPIPERYAAPSPSLEVQADFAARPTAQQIEQSFLPEEDPPEV